MSEFRCNNSTFQKPLPLQFVITYNYLVKIVKSLDDLDLKCSTNEEMRVMGAGSTNEINNV